MTEQTTDNLLNDRDIKKSLEQEEKLLFEHAQFITKHGCCEDISCKECICQVPFLLEKGRCGARNRSTNNYKLYYFPAQKIRKAIIKQCLDYIKSYKEMHPEVIEYAEPTKPIVTTIPYAMYAGEEIGESPFADVIALPLSIGEYTLRSFSYIGPKDFAGVGTGYEFICEGRSIYDVIEQVKYRFS